MLLNHAEPPRVTNGGAPPWQLTNINSWRLVVVDWLVVEVPIAMVIGWLLGIGDWLVLVLVIAMVIGFGDCYCYFGDWLVAQFPCIFPSIWLVNHW